MNLHEFHNLRVKHLYYVDKIETIGKEKKMYDFLVLMFVDHFLLI